MIIKQSKKTIFRQNKELYADNCKMRSELENLLARNSELVIMLEQRKREIANVNEKINQFNKGKTIMIPQKIIKCDTCVHSEDEYYTDGDLYSEAFSVSNCGQCIHNSSAEDNYEAMDGRSGI